MSPNNTMAVAMKFLLDTATELVAETTADTAAEIITKTVRRTPALTGRARGGWTIGINSPVSSPKDRLSLSGAETLLDELPKLQNLKLGQQVYISNDVPYISRLENGSSTQAPSGMVALTLREVLSE